MTIDDAMAEIAGLRSELQELEGFSDDAVKDETYWRRKARDHYAAFRGCVEENTRLRTQLLEALEVLTYTFGPTENSEKLRNAKVLELREWARQARNS